MFQKLYNEYLDWRKWEELEVVCHGEYMYNYEFQEDYQGPNGDLNPSEFKMWILRHYRMLFYKKVNHSNWCRPRAWYTQALKYTRMIRFAVGGVSHKVRLFCCDKFGHDWQDTSEAGPDSGDMSGYCKRCGTSFHHQLY